MLGPAGAERRLLAVKLTAAPATALGGAIVVIQISRVARVRAASPLKHVFTPGQIIRLDHCIAIERDQNPSPLFRGHVHAFLRAVLHLGTLH